MENYQMFFPCSSSNNTMGMSYQQLPSDNYGFATNRDQISHAVNGEFDNDHGIMIGNNNREEEKEEEKSSSGGDGNKTMVIKKGEKKIIKKQKHAFQTRSQVDILDDGYRWRKYGQKAVKNNNFPRSYYRCTHQGCNVKKQVQRLSKDEGIVVTTYEGIHTHPIEKHTDNFEHILNQMHIFNPI